MWWVDLIYGALFSHFALNNVQDEIAQQSSNIVSYRAPSYGLFATSLNTQYWFGVPRNVQFGGLSMDVDYASHQTVDKQNSQQGWINYNRAIGSRYSAMEHLVPEQMFSTDEAPAQGISAVKAIALASAEGQRIYTITSDNLYTAMAQLQLSADTEQEIQNAVEAGFEVTTHQYQINFNGWVGEGYIIIDPNTGAGAYKIAGGGNGGYVEPDDSFRNQILLAGLIPDSDDNVVNIFLGLLLAIGGALAESVLIAVAGLMFSLYSLWKDYVELQTAYATCSANFLIDLYVILGAAFAVLGLIFLGAGAVPAAIAIWASGVILAGAIRAVLLAQCT